MTRRLVVRLILALALAAGTLGTISAQQADRFYVIGYVKSPGEYTFESEMTVGDALAAAGGFVPGRTITELQIIRVLNGESQRIDVTLTDAVHAGDTVYAR